MKKVKFDFMKDIYPNMQNLLYNKIRSHSFENDLSLFTLEDPTKFSCEIEIMIGVGTTNESRKLAGISHLTEHMVFEGTRSYPQDKMLDFFKSIGGEINAETNAYSTIFTAKVPGMFSDMALEIILDMVLNPLIDEEKIEKEKSIILQELDEYDPLPLAEIFLHQLVKHNSYRLDPEKSKATIPNITRGNILNFMKKYYTPNNIAITISGNFDSVCAYHTIKYAFKDRKNNNYRITPFVINFEPFSYIEPYSDEPDDDDKCVDILVGWGDNRKYSLAVKTLANHFVQTHLNDVLRTEKALVYGAHVVNLKLLNNNFLTFATSTSTENVLSVLQEFSKVNNITITDDQLETYKNNILIEHCMAMEDARTVLYNRAHNSIFNLFSQNFVEFANSLYAVTKDDILNFINDLLARTPALILQGAISPSMQEEILDNNPFKK